MDPTLETLFHMFLIFCVIFTFYRWCKYTYDMFIQAFKRSRAPVDTDRISFHTDGPWKIERANNSVNAPDLCITSPDGKIIADVYGHALPNHFLPSVGNARLMAAGPQLLRALNELLQHSFPPVGDINSVYLRPYYDKAVKDAFAAIDAALSARIQTEQPAAQEISDGT